MEKYIVYITRNKKEKINGINRIYIGVHKTRNPEIFDGYIGCGVYIQQPSTYMYPKTPFLYAVKKYGVDSFERLILYIYDNYIEAYNKEREIVNLDFLKLDYTYNACLGGIHYYNYKSLYQFDLNGNLIKKWEYSKEAYDFYGYPMERFEYAIHDRHPFLNYLWSSSEKIDITEYSNKSWGEPKITHLYNKQGKWLGEFTSRKECAKFIESTESAVCSAISRQSLIKKQYYVSNSLVDLFIPKPKIQYYKSKFYVYKNNTLIFEGIGKDIMPVIGLNSWDRIRDIFNRNGWYKDFYISTEKVESVPELSDKKHIKVDVYTKYGDFIETLNKIKDVREKYNVPASKIKNIELGDRYFGDYIFKYHSKKSK